MDDRSEPYPYHEGGTELDYRDAVRRGELARIEPRTKQELREENREQLQQEVDRALEALREVYVAAACWMALKEFIVQSSGPCVLDLSEGEPDEDSITTKRQIVAHFAPYPGATGEADVNNQLANFADDVMGAIATENEKRRIERKGNPHFMTAAESKRAIDIGREKPE